jgi:hypothetical protein
MGRSYDRLVPTLFGREQEEGLKGNRDPRDPLEQDIKQTVLAWLFYIPPADGFFWHNPSTGIYDPRRGHYLKPNKFNIRGRPDIMGVYGGVPIGIEMKKKGGRQSPEQVLFQERFEKAGGWYILAYSLEDVARALGRSLTGF